MGIEFVRTWQFSGGNTTLLIADRDGAVVIDGYDHLLHTSRVYEGMPTKEFHEQGIVFRIGKDLSKITVSDYAKVVDSLQIDLLPLVNKLMSDYGNASTDKIPPEKMTIVAASQTTKVKLFLSSLRIERHGGETKLVAYDGEIAYKSIREK
jgi:hypothetical protein